MRSSPIFPTAAALLLLPRVPPPRLCAPLTCLRYGSGTSLHVDITGTRSVRRLESLPSKAKDSVRIVFVSDTHSQVSPAPHPPTLSRFPSNLPKPCHMARPRLAVRPHLACASAARGCRAADGRHSLPHRGHHLLRARRSRNPSGIQRADCKAAAHSQGRDRR